MMISNEKTFIYSLSDDKNNTKYMMNNYEITII